MSRYRAIEYNQPGFMDGFNQGMDTVARGYHLGKQFQKDRREAALQSELDAAGATTPTEVVGRDQAQSALESARMAAAEAGPMPESQSAAFAEAKRGLESRPAGMTYAMGDQSQAIPFSPAQVQYHRAQKMADVYDRFGDPARAMQTRTAGLVLDEGFHKRATREKQSDLLSKHNEARAKYDAVARQLDARLRNGEINDLQGAMELGKFTDGIPGYPTVGVNPKGQIVVLSGGKLTEYPPGTPMSRVLADGYDLLDRDYANRMRATTPEGMVQGDDTRFNRAIAERQVGATERQAGAAELSAKRPITQTTALGRGASVETTNRVVNGEWATERTRRGPQWSAADEGGSGGDVSQRMLAANDTVQPGPDGRPVRGVVVHYIGGSKEFLPGVSRNDLFKPTQAVDLSKTLYGKTPDETPASERALLRDGGLGTGVFGDDPEGVAAVAAHLTANGQGGRPPRASQREAALPPPLSAQTRALFAARRQERPITDYIGVVGGTEREALRRELEAMAAEEANRRYWEQRK